MDPVVRIQLFGIPRIKFESPRVSDLPTRKAKLLFYYLLVFSNTHHLRETLETIFWGDHQEHRARHSLSTELWRLRRWIGGFQNGNEPLLSMEDSQIRLQVPESWWLDVIEFERNIARARREQRTDPIKAVDLLRHAVKLYAGEFLEGCYYDWCLSERERLHQMYLDALLRLMVSYGAAHEYVLAIEFGQDLLRADPFREQVHRELIKLYALNNQIPQAIDQYQVCVGHLKAELGIAPSPETEAVMRQAVARQIKLPPAARDTRKHAPLRAELEMQELAIRVRTALEQVQSAQRELLDVLLTLDALKSAYPQTKNQSQRL